MHNHHKYQKISKGVGKWQFLSIFKGPLASPSERVLNLFTHPLHALNRFLLRSFSMSSYCAQLTIIMKSEGRVFDQKLAMCLFEVPFQYSDLTRTKNYIKLF